MHPSRSPPPAPSQVMHVMPPQQLYYQTQPLQQLPHPPPPPPLHVLPLPPMNAFQIHPIHPSHTLHARPMTTMNIHSRSPSPMRQQVQQQQQQMMQNHQPYPLDPQYAPSIPMIPLTQSWMQQPPVYPMHPGMLAMPIPSLAAPLPIALLPQRPSTASPSSGFYESATISSVLRTHIPNQSSYDRDSERALHAARQASDANEQMSTPSLTKLTAYREKHVIGLKISNAANVNNGTAGGSAATTSSPKKRPGASRSPVRHHAELDYFAAHVSSPHTPTASPLTIATTSSPRSGGTNISPLQPIPTAGHGQRIKLHVHQRSLSSYVAPQTQHHDSGSTQPHSASSAVSPPRASPRAIRFLYPPGSQPQPMQQPLSPQQHPQHHRMLTLSPHRQYDGSPGSSSRSPSRSPRNMSLFAPSPPPPQLPLPSPAVIGLQYAKQSFVQQQRQEEAKEQEHEPQQPHQQRLDGGQPAVEKTVTTRFHFTHSRHGSTLNGGAAGSQRLIKIVPSTSSSASITANPTASSTLQPSTSTSSVSSEKPKYVYLQPLVVASAYASRKDLHQNLGQKQGATEESEQEKTDDVADEKNEATPNDTLDLSTSDTTIPPENTISPPPAPIDPSPPSPSPIISSAGIDVQEGVLTLDGLSPKSLHHHPSHLSTDSAITGQGGMEVMSGGEEMEGGETEGGETEQETEGGETEGEEVGTETEAEIVTENEHPATSDDPVTPVQSTEQPTSQPLPTVDPTLPIAPPTGLDQYNDDISPARALQQFFNMHDYAEEHPSADSSNNDDDDSDEERMTESQKRRAKKSKKSFVKVATKIDIGKDGGDGDSDSERVSPSSQAARQKRAKRRSTVTNKLPSGTLAQSKSLKLLRNDHSFGSSSDSSNSEDEIHHPMLRPKSRHQELIEMNHESTMQMEAVLQGNSVGNSGRTSVMANPASAALVSGEDTFSADPLSSPPTIQRQRTLKSSLRRAASFTNNSVQPTIGSGSASPASGSSLTSSLNLQSLQKQKLLRWAHRAVLEVAAGKKTGVTTQSDESNNIEQPVSLASVPEPTTPVTVNTNSSQVTPTAATMTSALQDLKNRAAEANAAAIAAAATAERIRLALQQAQEAAEREAEKSRKMNDELLAYNEAEARSKLITMFSSPTSTLTTTLFTVDTVMSYIEIEQLIQEGGGSAIQVSKYLQSMQAAGGKMFEKKEDLVKAVKVLAFSVEDVSPETTFDEVILSIQQASLPPKVQEFVLKYSEVEFEMNRVRIETKEKRRKREEKEARKKAKSGASSTAATSTNPSKKSTPSNKSSRRRTMKLISLPNAIDESESGMMSEVIMVEEGGVQEVPLVQSNEQIAAQRASVEDALARNELLGRLTNLPSDSPDKSKNLIRLFDSPEQAMTEQQVDQLIEVGKGSKPTLRHIVQMEVERVKFHDPTQLVAAVSVLTIPSEFEYNKKIVNMDLIQHEISKYDLPDSAEQFILKHTEVDIEMHQVEVNMKRRSGKTIQYLLNANGMPGGDEDGMELHVMEEYDEGLGSVGMSTHAVTSPHSNYHQHKTPKSAYIANHMSLVDEGDDDAGGMMVEMVDTDITPEGFAKLSDQQREEERAKMEEELARLEVHARLLEPISEVDELLNSSPSSPSGSPGVRHRKSIFKPGSKPMTVTQVEKLIEVGKGSKPTLRHIVQMGAENVKFDDPTQLITAVSVLTLPLEMDYNENLVNMDLIQHEISKYDLPASAEKFILKHTEVDIEIHKVEVKLRRASGKDIQFMQVGEDGDEEFELEEGEEDDEEEESHRPPPKRNSIKTASIMQSELGGDENDMLVVDEITTAGVASSSPSVAPLNSDRGSNILTVELVDIDQHGLSPDGLSIATTPTGASKHLTPLISSPHTRSTSGSRTPLLEKNYSTSQSPSSRSLNNSGRIAGFTVTVTEPSRQPSGQASRAHTPTLLTEATPSQQSQSPTKTTVSLPAIGTPPQTATAANAISSSLTSSEITMTEVQFDDGFFLGGGEEPISASEALPTTTIISDIDLTNASASEVVSSRTGSLRWPSASTSASFAHPVIASQPKVQSIEQLPQIQQESSAISREPTTEMSSLPPLPIVPSIEQQPPPTLPSPSPKSSPQSSPTLGSITTSRHRRASASPSPGTPDGGSSPKLTARQPLSGTSSALSSFKMKSHPTRQSITGGTSSPKRQSNVNAPGSGTSTPKRQSMVNNPSSGVSTPRRRESIATSSPTLKMDAIIAGTSKRDSNPTSSPDSNTTVTHLNYPTPPESRTATMLPGTISGASPTHANSSNNAVVNAISGSSGSPRGTILAGGFTAKESPRTSPRASLLRQRPSIQGSTPLSEKIKTAAAAASAAVAAAITTLPVVAIASASATTTASSSTTVATPTTITPALPTPSLPASLAPKPSPKTTPKGSPSQSLAPSPMQSLAVSPSVSPRSSGREFASMAASVAGGNGTTMMNVTAHTRSRNGSLLNAPQTLPVAARRPSQGLALQAQNQTGPASSGEKSGSGPSTRKNSVQPLTTLSRETTGDSATDSDTGSLKASRHAPTNSVAFGQDDTSHASLESKKPNDPLASGLSAATMSAAASHQRPGIRRINSLADWSSHEDELLKMSNAKSPSNANSGGTATPTGTNSPIIRAAKPSAISTASSNSAASVKHHRKVTASYLQPTVSSSGSAALNNIREPSSPAPISEREKPERPSSSHGGSFKEPPSFMQTTQSSRALKSRTPTVTKVNVTAGANSTLKNNTSNSTSANIKQRTRRKESRLPSESVVDDESSTTSSSLRHGRHVSHDDGAISEVDGEETTPVANTAATSDKQPRALSIDAPPELSRVASTEQSSQPSTPLDDATATTPLAKLPPSAVPPMNTNSTPGTPALTQSPERVQRRAGEAAATFSLAAVPFSQDSDAEQETERIRLENERKRKERELAAQAEQLRAQALLNDPAEQLRLRREKRKNEFRAKAQQERSEEERKKHELEIKAREEEERRKAESELAERQEAERLALQSKLETEQRIAARAAKKLENDQKLIAEHDAKKAAEAELQRLQEEADRIAAIPKYLATGTVAAAARMLETQQKLGKGEKVITAAAEYLDAMRSRSEALREKAAANKQQLDQVKLNALHSRDDALAAHIAEIRKNKAELYESEQAELAYTQAEKEAKTQEQLRLIKEQAEAETSLKSEELREKIMHVQMKLHSTDADRARELELIHQEHAEESRRKAEEVNMKLERIKLQKQRENALMLEQAQKLKLEYETHAEDELRGLVEVREQMREKAGVMAAAYTPKVGIEYFAENDLLHLAGLPANHPMMLQAGVSRIDEATGQAVWANAPGAALTAANVGSSAPATYSAPITASDAAKSADEKPASSNHLQVGEYTRERGGSFSGMNSGAGGARKNSTQQ